MSGALSARALRDAIEDIERSDAGITFSAEQRAAIHAMGHGMKIGLLTGVAGSGKTTLLRPLVAAWKQDGRRIVGTSTAWRQSDALKDAGIDETVALQPLLRSIDEGRFQPDESTVLVIDEVSQISPRSMLRLMDLQARTDMTLEMLGDVHIWELDLSQTVRRLAVTHNHRSRFGETLRWSSSMAAIRACGDLVGHPLVGGIANQVSVARGDVE
jgi:energy-coupling factor transporter ATP-binding protein EcfA2